MNKVLGILILFGSLSLSIVLGKRADTSSSEALIIYAGFIMAMGLAYTIIHREKYPLKVVLVVLVVEFILLKIFEDDARLWEVRVELIRYSTIAAMVFTLIGPTIGKAFTFILSPLQRYLQSIGLKFDIPVIAGIIGFIIGFILFIFIY